MSTQDRLGREGDSAHAEDAHDREGGAGVGGLDPTRMRAMHRRWVQRKASRAGGGEGGGEAAAIPQAGGSALGGSTQTRMEKTLGADLSGVRVHTGGESAQAAESMGARAFTVGSDVHFNRGEFAPGSKEGDRLLAHELTHVVQGQKAGVQRKADHADSDGADGDHEAGGHEVSEPGDPAEHEADAAGDHAAEALHGGGEGKKGDKPKVGATAGAAVGRKVFRAPKPGAPAAPAGAKPPATSAAGAAPAGGSKDAPAKSPEEAAKEKTIDQIMMSMAAVDPADPTLATKVVLGLQGVDKDIEKFPKNEIVKAFKVYLTTKKQMIVDKCQEDMAALQAQLDNLDEKNPANADKLAALKQSPMMQKWDRNSVCGTFAKDKHPRIDQFQKGLDKKIKENETAIEKQKAQQKEEEEKKKLAAAAPPPPPPAPAAAGAAAPAAAAPAPVATNAPPAPAATAAPAAPAPTAAPAPASAAASPAPTAAPAPPAPTAAPAPPAPTAAPAPASAAAPPAPAPAAPAATAAPAPPAPTAAPAPAAAAAPPAPAPAPPAAASAAPAPAAAPPAPTAAPAPPASAAAPPSTAAASPPAATAAPAPAAPGATPAPTADPAAPAGASANAAAPAQGAAPPGAQGAQPEDPKKQELALKKEVAIARIKVAVAEADRTWKAVGAALELINVAIMGAKAYFASKGVDIPDEAVSVLKDSLGMGAKAKLTGAQIEGILAIMEVQSIESVDQLDKLFDDANFVATMPRLTHTATKYSQEQALQKEALGRLEAKAGEKKDEPATPAAEKKEEPKEAEAAEAEAADAEGGEKDGEEKKKGGLGKKLAHASDEAFETAKAPIEAESAAEDANFDFKIAAQQFSNVLDPAKAVVATIDALKAQFGGLKAAKKAQEEAETALAAFLAEHGGAAVPNLNAPPKP